MAQGETTFGIEATAVRAGGLPAWITPELLALTVEVWQPYYHTPLTTDDAIGILQNVGRLVDVLEGPG